MVKNTNDSIVAKGNKYSKIIELLYSAKQSGVDITLDKDQLKLRLHEDKTFDEKLLKEIKNHKPLIIEFLSKRNLKSEKIDNKYNKIKPFDRTKIETIPLSFSQERLWFIDQLEGSVQYHISQALRIKGNLYREALGGALQGIVNRHEVLRTVILDQEGHPYQYIKQKDGWELSVVDGSMYKEDADGLRAYIEGLNKKPFDLSKDYMLRAVLIKLEEQEHILALTLHHIASDGWSRSVLIRELAEIYRSYAEGREAQLAVLPVQYADYAIWQRSYLQGETWERKIGYWKEKLEGISTLQLPTDYVRPAVQSTRGSRENFSIDKEVSEGLRSLCRKEGTTMFMTLQAVVKVLLYRYSGQQDICVGTAIAGRQQQELEGLIGFFVNTLALRDEVDGAASFRELLQTVKATTLEAYEHQEVPFEKVVDVVVKERDLSRNPLFQVMFVLQNLPEAPRLQLGEVELSRDVFAHDTSRFDLTFTITEGEVLRGSVEYCTALYKKETIERMMVHFKELVGSVVREPDQRIGMLPMLSVAEKNQLLVEFNDTETEYQKEKTIIELFEDQVIKTPDAVALVFEEHTLTYKKLNERSNRLAHYLRERGVKAETLVPVCIERSIEMVVGILGILKAGGAYVPVDTEYPAERIGYILEDTGAAVVVSSRESREKVAVREGIDIIETDGEWPEKSSEQQENLSIALSAVQLAYVIYTSGSTGKPKGVMVEHGNLVNYLLNSKARYVREDGGSSGSFIHLSCTFDASLTAMFMPLFSGKSIIIGSKHGVEVFEDSNLQKYAPYDFLKITPAHLELLQPVIRNGEGALLTERLVIGGEALRLSHFSYYIDKGIDVEIINEYGPTEATVGCSTYSFWTVRDQEKIKNEISIGKPIDNAQIYILGKNNELVPAGIDGEICVGGAGVARGYLNRDDLTAEKFIGDPFKKEEGARIYKTGDLGRWLLDGNIEYAGRKDDQVKIRGYRIELGEIESNVLQSGMVSQAVVVAREDKEGNKKLTGYVVPTPEVVKAKEIELYSVQVATWKELYETEYGQTEGDESVDPEFNIIGWNDSFTGMANPAEQMQEWLQDIVEVIMAEDPGHVLEIGCGTGLIYYQLAGKVKKYIGADLSRSSINQITERIGKGYRNYGPTELQVAPAHEVTLKADEEVDTIILNSMVQYFPGEDYMNSVVEKSISLLKGKGRIIIGDVRDYRLLKLFKARLNLKKLQDKVSVKEFKWMLDQEVLKEEELCFSPGYFYQLQSLYPNITNIEIQWKQGSYINELTLYRYTVVIHLGIEKELIEPEWESWQGTKDTNNIIEKLQQGDITTLALKDVPNPRLWKEKLLEDALNNKSVLTIGDIVTDKQDEESEGIAQMLTVAKAKGYKYRLLLNEDPLKMNVLIEQKFSSGFVKQEYIEKDSGSKGWNTNIPLFTDIGFLLQKDIKHFLQQRLPEYMIPLELISLDHLPLTTNGKIDRIFLNQREDKAATNKLNYQPARTETEQMLVTIWEKLLNADRIGIYDNFFDLGGHSLLATRTVSAIRKELEIEIAIKDLFIYPTIAKLSKYLQGQARGSALPSIEVQERPERIPLSFSQERLWFIDQLEGSVQYHIPQVLRLRGNLNKETIKDALQTIVNRHEVLRTVIVEEEGHPYQQVKEKHGWELGIFDGREYREDAKGLQQYIYGLIKKPFDFSKDYMLRADLIEVEEQEHVLVVTLHHIASDGWSTSVMVRELAEIYRSYAEGREARLAVLPVQYADYAIWQRRYLQGEIWEKKIGYWKEKLGETMVLQLPTDYVRPAVQSTRGSRESFSIDKEVSEGLQLLSRKEGATMFMTLLSVVKVLLYRYSGQQDISIGTAIAGRQQQEVEGLIGFFVNTLALRDEVDGAASFSELLQSVKTTTLDAYEHQEVPFERVVEAVVKERDLSRSPLFQVMFVLQNTPEVPRLELGEVALSREPFTQNTSKFDLSFNITETGERLGGSVQYCTDLYKAEKIERMIGHFKELLASIVQSPGEKIGKLRMLIPAEEEQLLKTFNDTASDYPKDKSIAVLFEEQAAKTPHNIALVYEEEAVTYRELNERSNQLARYLQKKGVKQETLVPICVERGMGMITGILGILKAGGAYVPIDPEYPQDRISYMLEDTAARVLVSSAESKEKLQSTGRAEIISIDGDWKAINKEAKTNLPGRIASANLAYIIYTSGSTGTPKGVMIEHRNVVRLFQTEKPLFDFNEKDVWTMFHSFCFDFSVWEMYGALLYGGRLVIVPLYVSKDAFLFSELLLKESVTIVNQTPSAFYVLQDALTAHSGEVNIRYVIFGGEALNPSKLRPWKKKYGDSCSLINMYGITETTVHVTYQEIGWNEIENGGSIIGKTIPTLSAYILDANQNLLPIGIPGEICISGEGLSRGYLNRDDLTEAKFIQNPFSNLAGSRIYRSGDVGRWLANGTIEYLGRMDDQVKIRGYRIELGEIEAILIQSGMVKSAIVLAKDRGEESKQLIGYLVVNDQFQKQALIRHLHTKLPDYMIPAIWVQLDNLPLTSNGKINKNALPDPDTSLTLSAGYVAARNELEAGLVEIWKAILHLNRVGIHDNFFEIGGHSLLVIRLVSAIKRKLNVEPTINDIFIHPTIASFTENVVEKVKNPSRKDANIKYLVSLKEGGNGVPLYIVCGEGGTSLRFKKFSELMGKDQAVYALQLPLDYKQLQELPTTVEEISKGFIEEILIDNPEGPYALSGHCLGGYIAFEMAKQLIASGKKVHLLTLFDTVLRKSNKIDLQNLKKRNHATLLIKRFFLKLILKLNFEFFLFRKHTKHAIHYKMNSLKLVFYKLKYRKELKAGDLDFVGLDIFKKPTIYSKACKTYKLTPLDHELILFYAKERYYFTDSEKQVAFKKLYLNDRTKNLWNQYATSIKIHETQGDHSTMFETNHAQEFAKTLQEYLNDNERSK